MVVNEDSKFFDDEHGQLTRADYENFDITFKDVTEGCKALLNKISEKNFSKFLGFLANGYARVSGLTSQNRGEERSRS